MVDRLIDNKVHGRRELAWLACSRHGNRRSLGARRQAGHHGRVHRRRKGHHGGSPAP